MTIVLEPEIEALLRRRAVQEGKPVETVAADLIVASLQKEDSVVLRAIGAWQDERIAREGSGDFRSAGEIHLAERRTEAEERDRRLLRLDDHS